MSDVFLTINLAGSIVQLFDVYLHKLVVTQIFPRLTVVAAHVFMIRLEANFFSTSSGRPITADFQGMVCSRVRVGIHLFDLH